MSRITVLGTWALCASLSVACGRGDRTETARGESGEAEIDLEETSRIIATGCLTASGDRYVLTSLESGDAPETQLYQLVGQEDELRRYVGRQVRVSGDSEPAEVAELRENSAPAPAATTGDQGVDAKVQTQAQTRLETRQMRVVSVTATGDECPAGRPEGQQ